MGSSVPPRLEVAGRALASLVLVALLACGPAEDPADAVLGDPARLRGQSAEEIRALLGAPALLRRDGEAEVWQYPAEGCFLDLFLYKVEELGEARLVVSHFEIRNRGGAAVSSRRCLSALVVKAPDG